MSGIIGGDQSVTDLQWRQTCLMRSSRSGFEAVTLIPEITGQQPWVAMAEEVC